MDVNASLGITRWDARRKNSADAGSYDRDD